MSKAKEEFYKFKKEWNKLLESNYSVSAADYYIEELKNQNEEMKNMLIDIIKTNYKTAHIGIEEVEMLVEKITGKSIEEALK